MKEDWPHILVVDDDDRIRTLLMRFLSMQDMIVIAAEDAAHARQIMKEYTFDLVVLDIMMPGESGLNLTRFLKDSSDVPVLLLTAKGSVEERIEGLEAGADDYLPKPFEPKELLLRIEAIIRRANKQGSSHASGHVKDDEVRIGPWSYDASLKRLKHHDGEEAGDVPLTDSEVALLNAMIRRPDTPIKRDILAQQVGMEGNDRAVDVQVTRLRKKIEDDPKLPKYLQTVRGQGYLLRIGGCDAS